MSPLEQAEVCLDQVDVNGIAEVLKSKSSLLPFFDVEKWRLVLSEKEVHSKISIPIIKAFLHTQKDGNGKKVPVGGKRPDLVSMSSLRRPSFFKHVRALRL